MLALNGISISIIVLYLLYSFFICCTLRNNKSEEMRLIKEFFPGYAGRFWFLLLSCLSFGILPLALMAGISIKKGRTRVLTDPKTDPIHVEAFGIGLTDDGHNILGRPPKYIEEHSWRIGMMNYDEFEDFLNLAKDDDYTF